jgi:DNA-binding HxlR family transcriptional regulator
MQHLQITNSHFITYKNEHFIIDILGGVDLQQVERMVTTLRITYQNYPPFRTTLDLYNDAQTEKLQRTICDKWNVKLNDASKTLHSLTLQLEEYRLQELKFIGKEKTQQTELTAEQRAEAKIFLQHKNLTTELTTKLNTTGILGEDENALILFLTLSSYKYNNPFSVLCMAKNGIGKSYLLQKLSECMPMGSYSLHSRISANALYYFDSSMIQNKALLIEDIEWTKQMLNPLATLQTQGRLTNTRATKDKDGMLHSTTFEVVANLCLIACTDATKYIDEASLPFLCVTLNHSHLQDIAIMEYQKKIKAGLIQNEDIKNIQQQLKNVITTLQNVSIINPFATLINLPTAINYPRKSLLLLLNFIEIITYFFQYQREQIVNKTTGEVFIKTHPNDIELAFTLLKPTLFKRADELSTTARNFYNWLVEQLQNTKEFTALDIRKIKTIHPRTLARHLQELVLFNYIQICGGNKHRGGFIYKLTELDNQNNVQSNIEKDLQATLKNIWATYNNEKVNEEEVLKVDEVDKIEVKKVDEVNSIEPNKSIKRKRIEDKEKHTLQLLIELNNKEIGRTFLPEDFTNLTGRSYTTEARYLKTLWEENKLNRFWQNRQYYYSLSPSFGGGQGEAATTTSKTVSQNPLSNTQSITA